MWIRKPKSEATVIDGCKVVLWTGRASYAATVTLPSGAKFASELQDTREMAVEFIVCTLKEWGFDYPG